jgi:hypothetical protein
VATPLHTFTSRDPKVLTLAAADTTYEVILPRRTPKVSIRFRSNAGRFQSADVAMTAADDYITMDAGTLYTEDTPRELYGNPPVIYLATGTGGTEVEVLPTPAE